MKYLTARGLQAVAGLLSTYLFTRWLTAADYGVYSVAMGIVGPLLALLAEWVAQPTARFFREYEVNKRLGAYRRTLGLLLAVVLLMSAAAGAIVVTFATPAWGFSLAVAAGATLLVDSALAVLVAVLPVSFHGGLYRLLEVGRAVGRFGFSLLLVRLTGASGAALMWGGVISGGLALVVAGRAVLRLLVHLPEAHSSQRRWHWDWQDVSRFVRYGLPMMVWFFGSQLLALGDRIVIHLYRGEADVGIYAASYSLVNSISQMLAGPILLAASPIIWRLWAEAPRSEVRRAIADISGWFFALGAGLAGGLGVFAQDVVRLLLGPEFHGGYVIVLPVVLGATIWNLSMVGHKPLELAERTGLLMSAVLSAAGLNLALNFLLVPDFGIAGAAYATLISYVAYAVLIGLLTWRTGMGWRLPADRTVPAIVAAVVAAVFSQRVDGSGAFGFVVRLLLFGMLYGIVFTVGFVSVRRLGRSHAPTG